MALWVPGIPGGQSEIPPVCLLSTPGHQPGALRLSNRERARANLGEGLSPRASAPQASKEDPTQLGEQWFPFFPFFFFFFFFILLAAHSQKARTT